MADFETKVRVTAQAKGFDKVQQEAAKLKDAQQSTTQGFQAATKAVATFQTTLEKAFKAFSSRGAKKEVEGLNEIIGELEEQLSSTAERQLELQKAMLDTEKGSEAYKKIAAEMKKLDGEAAQVNKTLGLVERAFKKQIQTANEAAAAARQASGAFRQGFAQGAGFGEFVQRGPGMGRQMLGRIAGGAAVGAPMGVARGVASMPFQGLQGLAGGLQGAAAALPFGTGVPIALGATAMMSAASMAGPAIGFERQRMESAPFLGGAFAQQGAAARRRQGALAAAGLTTEQIDAAVKKAGDVAAERVAAPPKTTAERLNRINTAMAMSFVPMSARQMDSPRPPEQFGLRNIAGEQRAARDKAEKEERARLRAEARKVPGGDAFERIGRRFGMATPEITELAGGISQVGGGRGDQLLQGRRPFMETAAAARRLGIGPEVSGAFLQAQRRGGIAGVRPGEGVASTQMVEAFSDATKMGLEGSEANEYLATIAEGIQSWKQTGIPVAKEAMAGIGLAFAQKGLGGVRGAAVAQGMIGAAQQLSRGGPTTATQLMMMQTLGGFKGGGAAGLEESQIQLEELRGKSPAEMGGKGMDFIKRVLEGFGGVRPAAREALGQMGINFGAREFQMVAKQAMGQELTDDEKKTLKLEREQREKAAAGGPTGGVAGFQAFAESMKKFAPNIDKTIEVQNAQLEVGQRMIPTLNNLDMAMANIADGFSQLAAGPLADLSGAIEKITQAAAGKKGLAEALSDAFSGTVTQ